jgi:hypothetical protein
MPAYLLTSAACPLLRTCPQANAGFCRNQVERLIRQDLDAGSAIALLGSSLISLFGLQRRFRA